MDATGWTKWVDARRLVALSAHTTCGAVNTPVGVITFEYSNDPQCAVEIGNGTLPANTTAKFASVTIAASGGDSWSAGYNGSGNKSSVGSASTSFGFIRLKYAKTSGGVGDTLSVAWNAAERWNR
jgi:hypothetical protein